MLTLFWSARWNRSMFLYVALVLNASVMTFVKLIWSGTAYLRTQPPWWCSDILIYNTSEINLCAVSTGISFHLNEWEEKHSACYKVRLHQFLRFTFGRLKIPTFIYRHLQGNQNNSSLPCKVTYWSALAVRSAAQLVAAHYPNKRTLEPDRPTYAPVRRTMAFTP